MSTHDQEACFGSLDGLYGPLLPEKDTMNLSDFSQPWRDAAPGNAAQRMRSALGAQYGRSRPGEPPFERGAVPFLGCAIDYGKDAGAFLASLRRRHGDVFTVFLAGQRMTFLLDPLDHAGVLLDERLDFHELANEISAKAFGHTLESLKLVDGEAVIRLSIERMRGADLEEMTRRMQEKLELVLLSEAPPRGDGLHAFVAKVIFLASCDALFGDAFATEGLFRQFEVLDRQFPLLVAGVPARFLPGVSEAREAVGRRFATEFASASALLLAREALFRGVVDEHTRRAYELALVWAAVANTIPATFWSLFHIVRDPAVRRVIEAEVRGVIAGARRHPATGRPVFDRQALGQMVQLDSAIDEAFRMTSGSLVIRVAREATEVTLHDGRRVPLRAGDQLALYPYLTHHDPEIYDDPATYRHDRFLEDGKPRRTFTRRGERVRHHLMPFGGGVSMCPGRHFARNEIKLTVAFLLHDFDLEVLDATLPSLDQSRAGLGILPPTRDVPYRLTRRAP